MQEHSIFTRIINREIPQEIIYEDDICIVIPTIEPITKGHILVIPKEQIDHLWDVEDDTYQHILLIAKMMAKRIREAYSYQRISMLVEGYGVPHAHIHLFGLNQPIEPTITQYFNHKYTASPEELADTASRLRI